MLFVFSLLFLGGDTVTLTNGEIFVGKVVARNEQRLWLKLDKGGVLTFDRERIVELQVGGKALAGGQETEPASKEAEKPKAPAAPATPADSGKKPPVAASSGSNQAAREDFARYALKCPVGFKKDQTAVVPPLVCVLREVESGALITLSAEPFQKGLAAAVDKLRAESGEGLRIEQEFRLRDAELDGQLFERDIAVEGAIRSELRVVFVYEGTLFTLSGSVRKNLLDQYRDVFRETFACFKLAKVRSGESAGATRSAAKPVLPPVATPPAASAARTVTPPAAPPDPLPTPSAATPAMPSAAPVSTPCAPPPASAAPVPSREGGGQSD